MELSEYAGYDAVGLAELVQRGETTPGELVEAAIGGIEAQNGELNAVIHTRYERALSEARSTNLSGPLAGVPFLVKDLGSELAGSPLNSGSRLLKDYVPNTDAELFRRYKEAGLIIVGKTNTPEFGLAPYTEPELHGATLNPWNTKHTPGGSSGGSAAAVAAGIVPAAHAGDGGGSIRIPASCCGLFGLKPTRARTPAGPVRGPGWNGAAVEHVVSRSVRDSAAILDATAGADTGAPYYPPPPSGSWLDAASRDPAPLRIGVCMDPLLSDIEVHEDCREAVRSTALLLEELGHTVEEARPELDAEVFRTAFLTMIAAEVYADVEQSAAIAGKEKADWNDLEPSTWMLADLGRTTTAGNLVIAVRDLERQTRKVGAFFTQYDMLLTPTLGRPPVEIGSLKPSGTERAAARSIHSLGAGWALKAFDLIRKISDRTFSFIPFTPVFNATGQPAMSVPLHWNDAGLPIGVQIVGRYAGETELYRLAGQLERARPWASRRPLVHVG